MPRQSSRVMYAMTCDGYSLAYRVTGSGPPCVILPAIWHHLEVIAPQNQAWRDSLRQRFSLVEYDNRGQGLSTRGLHNGFKMEDLVTDLETIWQHVELDTALIIGIGTASHTAIRFAARHPERVQALVLSSASLVTGPTWPVSLVEEDWNGFLSLVAGSQGNFEAVQESKRRLAAMLTREDAVHLFRASQASRVTNEVSQVRAPTLVLHARQVEWPSLEQSAEVAASIRGAQLAEVEGGWPLIQGDTPSFMAALDSFIADLSLSAQPPQLPAHHRLDAGLSTRELEVLRLIAGGMTNQEIADTLFISANTVRRHVSHILDKTGAANRAQAAAKAKEIDLI